MKKLLTVVFTVLLAGSLAFAQGTIGDKGKTTSKTASVPQPVPGKSSSTKTKTKAHKGGKKGSTTTTTPPPK